MKHTDINVGDTFGDRKVVFKCRYPLTDVYPNAHYEGKTLARRLSVLRALKKRPGLIMVWMLCKCGDLSIVGPSGGYNSRTCRQCALKVVQTAIILELKYKEQLSCMKRSARFRERDQPLCAGCKKPSTIMTCNDCKSSYLRGRR